MEYSIKDHMECSYKHLRNLIMIFFCYGSLLINSLARLTRQAEGADNDDADPKDYSLSSVIPYFCLALREIHVKAIRLMTESFFSGIDDL